jgi:hypothetical protein
MVVIPSEAKDLRFREMPTKKQIPHSAAETKNSPAWIETGEFFF